MKCFDISVYIFKILCGVAALSMVGFWIFKFHKNDDISAIEYISYETHPDIIYPELSICVLRPFITPNLFSSSKGNISVFEYSHYIDGKRAFRDEYEEINFHNVTLDIFQYVKYIQIYLRNQTFPKPWTCETQENCSYIKLKNNFNGFFNGHITRCFGFGVDLEIVRNVNAMYVVFKQELNILLNRFRKHGSGQTFLVLNYPNQMLRNPGVWTPIWKNTNDSIGMLQAIVSTNEILRRRNKNKAPCFVDWRYFDNRVLSKHHATVGCSPPYHKSSFSSCTSKKEIIDSRYEMNGIRNRYFPVPCEEMSNIVFTVDKLERSGVKSPELYFSYPYRTKVIQQVKAVDFQALIGNIGGYIGLLLGKMKY